MYNNPILDTWLNAIDSYIFVKNGQNLELKIDISDKNYFEKIVKKIPQYYNGKLIQEKVISYGEIGFISAVMHFLIYNMDKSEEYRSFVNLFTINEVINYQSIVEFFKYNKNFLSKYFDDMVNFRLNPPLEFNNPYIKRGIKLTDSITIFNFTTQTYILLMSNKIYTVLDLISFTDLENIKYMKAENLKEIKDKLLGIEHSKFDSSEIYDNLEYERGILNKKINKLISKDPKSAYLFLISSISQCEDYIDLKLIKSL